MQIFNTKLYSSQIFSLGLKILQISASIFLFFKTWHRGPSVYFSPESCLSSAAVFRSIGFPSLIFTEMDRSIISAAYYTSNKYFRGLFKNPSWRPGIYSNPAFNRENMAIFRNYLSENYSEICSSVL